MARLLGGGHAPGEDATRDVFILLMPERTFMSRHNS
jgi:hypothetical protein